MDIDVPYPIFSQEEDAEPSLMVKTEFFFNMSVLPTANTVFSNQPALQFHHLSLLPMTDLEERPETVLDACQSNLQVDLVAALVNASALPESVILANAMEKMFLINGLYWTKDGKMWVPDDKDLRYEVFLDCHASV